MIKLLNASLKRNKKELSAGVTIIGRQTAGEAIGHLGELAKHLLGTAHQIGAKAGLSPKQVEAILHGREERQPRTEHTEPTGPAEAQRT